MVFYINNQSVPEHEMITNTQMRHSGYQKRSCQKSGFLENFYTISWRNSAYNCRFFSELGKNCWDDVKKGVTNFKIVLMGESNTLPKDILRFIQETLPRLVVATRCRFRVVTEPFKFVFQECISILKPFSDRDMCHTAAFKKGKSNQQRCCIGIHFAKPLLGECLIVVWKYLSPLIYCC